MRLFVALWPPRQVLAELDQAASAARAGTAGLRWTPAAQWHLSLAFLGEVDEALRPELQARLFRATARHAPLMLRMDGGGRFGDRVLYTAVQGDRDGLRRLAGSVAAAARRSGLPMEDRPYRPHLTLARSRDGVDLGPAVAALAGFHGRVWTATTVHLVHSRLGTGPGRSPDYTTLASWPLSGRVAGPRT